jgi:Pumilio-family RNA binding repeat
VIEKVIQQCDQQASLFLQQKLKLASPAQKHEIVDAIVRHCYPLMINRFGNFLVQRCFEYGTKDQMEAIANCILGNVVALSTDMFGCHVIQKAFDCVNEDCKAAMVKELLCRIPETVSHRFACHVWQKLLEIRWLGAPPVVMKYVNDSLKGRWTEVALGETGSLVVQNIFENCLDEDKVSHLMAR